MTPGSGTHGLSPTPWKGCRSGQLLERRDKHDVIEMPDSTISSLEVFSVPVGRSDVCSRRDPDHRHRSGSLHQVDRRHRTHRKFRSRWQRPARLTCWPRGGWFITIRSAWRRMLWRNGHAFVCGGCHGRGKGRQCAGKAMLRVGGGRDGFVVAGGGAHGGTVGCCRAYGPCRSEHQGGAGPRCGPSVGAVCDADQQRGIHRVQYRTVE